MLVNPFKIFIGTLRFRNFNLLFAYTHNESYDGKSYNRQDNITKSFARSLVHMVYVNQFSTIYNVLLEL